MNKTILKIYGVFIASAVLISMILLVINSFSLALTASEPKNMDKVSPRTILSSIAENLRSTEKGFLLEDKSVLDEEQWCILIDSEGQVVWSENMPQDIPKQYSINDIAQMTRWYLKDYPVYVRTEEYGLLVLGYPKHSLGKYSMEYSMEWFDTLAFRIAIVFLFNISLATFFACILSTRLYKRLKILIGGIKDLEREQDVHLEEKGMFREVARNINETSNAIQHKNMLLQQRDSARSNWIAGISHDIRTPLSIILGYAEELTDSQTLLESDQNKAVIITAQTVKIKKLIEDLNLISSLEYDMQPSQKKRFPICALLRKVVSALLNTGFDEKFSLELDLRYEKAMVLGDEALLERAIFNIINNSMIHNKGGCTINVSEELEKLSKVVRIRISDNGVGVNPEILRNMEKIPKSAHGLGLPMAYKIITAHGGAFTAENNNGFHVCIELPEN